MSMMIRSQFSDFFLADALPALEFIVSDEYQQFAAQYEKLFNVKNMSGSIAQSSQISSLQPAGQVGEGEQLPMQKISQGFSKTYTAVKYGILLATSQELIDDQEFDLMGSNARKLTKAFMSTVEMTSADVLNTAFSATGPDGKVLCAVDHPLLAPGAGTNSNRLGTDADLSMTSLKAAITLMRGTLDTAGNKVNLKGKNLIVHPSNEFTAVELLESQMLVDAANANVNAVNSVMSRYSLQPVIWDYLTDEDAWFIQSDKDDHNMCFYWRKQAEIDTDYEFKSKVALTSLVGRFAVGYSDWRGIVGTPGA